MTPYTQPMTEDEKRRAREFGRTIPVTQADLYWHKPLSPYSNEPAFDPVEIDWLAITREFSE